MNRSEINRALAKAIAFKACGKHAQAELWAAKLIGLLECANIIDPDRVGLMQIARDVKPIETAQAEYDSF